MSTAKFNQWLNSDGTENYKCRAWVNFNGTGTVAIRASGNVSSITDNGTGDYTVNFTNAMPDENYAVSCTTGIAATTSNYVLGIYTGVSTAGAAAITKTTSALRVFGRAGGGSTTIDTAENNVAIFR